MVNIVCYIFTYTFRAFKSLQLKLKTIQPLSHSDTIIGTRTNLWPPVQYHYCHELKNLTYCSFTEKLLSFQEKQDLINTLKLENERLLSKIRCTEEDDPDARGDKPSVPEDSFIPPVMEDRWLYSSNFYLIPITLEMY